MKLNCLNCHKDIPIQDAVYCPFCGIDLVKVKKKTGFPIAAGVLTIIASCIAFFPGIAGLITSFSYANTLSAFSYYSITYILMAVFGILSFALGITVGIFILKRKRFAFAIFGLAINIFAAFVISVVSSIAILFFGAPILVLSIIGLAFTAISRKEFS